MIKVIHIITMLEMGGAQGNTLFTVAHLDRNKFQVGLISGPGGILDDEAGRIGGVDLKFVPPLVRSIHPIKDLFALAALTKVLRRERPDIIHTHSSKAGILGRMAATAAGVPGIIHSIHGFGFNPYQKPYVRWLFVFLERVMAKFTHVLIAVSEENIATGLRLGIGSESLYTLIRSGVDIQNIKRAAAASDAADLKRKLDIPRDARIILSAGPFKLQKDPIAFVECAAKVARQVPNVRFLWSGDGELRTRVEKKIGELRLDGVVKLLGWREDVPALLNLCDVFVLTSLWEGLPRAAVEALIAGKPVVAFSVDGLPEIVKDGRNGFLLSPGNHEAFAAQVIRLLKDQELYQRFSAEAAHTIDSSFDIHFMVRQQEQLYDRLVRSRVSPDGCIFGHTAGNKESSQRRKRL